MQDVVVEDERNIRRAVTGRATSAGRKHSFFDVNEESPSAEPPDPPALLLDSAAGAELSRRSTEAL